MKEELISIDRMLANMNVSGDNVLILAAARSALLKVYNEIKEAENVPSKDGG